ncbi:unnamed protein product [Cylicocyclus nassatus]|uniref:Uncharacterized protein n=1 Tax=Cylicocyclus nassatus TaxID=53992 RepID=A0AA36MFL2_CYLNA|nr:unnamed protein product [Cylicocyclus nassatus]
MDSQAHYNFTHMIHSVKEDLDESSVGHLCNSASFESPALESSETSEKRLLHWIRFVIAAITTTYCIIVS